MWCLVRQTRRRRFCSRDAADAFAARVQWDVAYSLPPAGSVRPYFLESIVLRRAEDLAPFDTVLAVGDGDPPAVRFRVRRSEMRDARTEEEARREFPELEGWDIVSQSLCPNSGKRGFTRFYLEQKTVIWAAELEPGDEILANLGPAEPEAD